MADSKLAVSWADILLIILLSVLGAGLWSASSYLVNKWIAPPTPSLQAQADSLTLQRLEAELDMARENRSFLHEKFRELRMASMRKEMQLRLRESVPVREELELDSKMAPLLNADISRADNAADARRRELVAAQKAAEDHRRSDQTKLEARRLLWTGVAACLAVLLIVLGFTVLLRPAKSGEPRIRRTIVFGTASLVIVLTFMHQVAGILGVVALVSIAALGILVWTLLRAPA